MRDILRDMTDDHTGRAGSRRDDKKEALPFRRRDHGRYAYNPIHGRPDFSWPGDRRLAVYLGVNAECFSFGEGLGAALAPGGPQPDVLNYAWRDYGNRVGDLAHPGAGGPARPALHGARQLRHLRGGSRRGRGVPRPWGRDRGHGRTNAEAQGTLSEADERALIAEATATLAAHEGRAPQGWLGPWISQSAATPDLLHEADYGYLLDWCHDDQPVWMRTRAGRILSTLYPQELNDIPQIVSRRREAAEFAEMIAGAGEVMLEESARRPLVMGIALHGYIMGQPHRIRHLERALRHLQREGATGCGGPPPAASPSTSALGL